MEIKRILQLQIVFGKTHEGRFIGKSLLPLIENSLNNPELSKTKIISCSNCGLVLEEEMFSNGCMNCGSKDFELID